VPSGREAGRLGEKQALCGDTSQCLLGFPENLFRVQSIGFFPPLTPQIIRTFIKRRKRI